MHLKKLVTAMIIGSFMLATVPTNLVLAGNETAVVETTKEEIVPTSQEENKSEDTANKEETKSDNQTLENTEEKSENEREVQLEDKKVEKANKTEHKKIENKKENKVEKKNNSKKKDTVNSKKNGNNTKYAFTSDSINMRSQANTKSKVLVTLKKNTKITILKKENGWLKVQYGKKVGYVSAKYVKVTSNSTSTSKPVGTQKPVVNNNSNSVNKKPTSNTKKGLSVREFEKQLPKLGYKEFVVDQYGGTYDYYVGQRLVGFCDYRHTKKGNDTIRVSFVIYPDTINESYLKDWNVALRNSFNLLLPTEGDRLHKMIVTKEKEGKLSELDGKTFDMDGRKVKIELDGEIYVDFFEK